MAMKAMKAKQVPDRRAVRADPGHRPAPPAGTNHFPKLCAAARLLPRDPDAALGDADLVRLICSDCPFYKEGEDEELECGAFMLLRHLLLKKVVTVAGILDAVRPGDDR